MSTLQPKIITISCLAVKTLNLTDQRSSYLPCSHSLFAATRKVTDKLNVIRAIFSMVWVCDDSCQKHKDKEDEGNQLYLQSCLASMVIIK